jgi:CarboxypepD_reg-like domain
MSKYWFLWLVSNCALGQIALKGKVTDAKNSATPNVNLTLHRYNSSAILAFAITDKTGQYDIQCTTDADTLLLKVYAMGYASQEKIILNKSQKIDFSLTQKQFELKEVVVKSKPIRQYGDTITYSVNAFKTEGDRAIGDLIKRLPGIEINASGAIFYQGKPINKYYIEGMDLLGGKYSLANENLPVDAVTSVEVLENHQPIRMLDSLSLSDKAAINIRLKNNIVTTGTAKVGLGGKPLLWDANVTPMLFQKNNQFIGSYQTNNIGNNVAKQIKILTVDDVLNPFENDDSKKKWVQIMPINTPAFADARWLDNNIHLGSINYLKKLSNAYELRTNVSYLNDYQQQRGLTQSINYTANDTINFTEYKRNSLFFSTLDANFTIQKNDKSKFFKNQLSIKKQWDSEQGMIELNSNPTKQAVSSPFFCITNNLKDLFKIGKQLITLQSFTNFRRSPQSLQVSPISFGDLFKVALDSVAQTTTFQSFYSHNMLSLQRGIKGFSVLSQVGFIVEKQQLKSDITSGEIKGISTDFKNDLHWNRGDYYAKFNVQFRRKRWNFNINLPFHFYDFGIKDPLFKTKELLQKATIEPKLGINYDISPLWRLSVSTSKSNSFGEIESVFYGYMLRNYRTLERRNVPLMQTVSVNQAANITYRNPLSSIFGYLIFSNTKTNNNLIYGTRITAKGTTEQYATLFDNYSDFQSVMINVGKYFQSIKTQFRVEYSLINTERQQIVNGITAPFKNIIINKGLRLSTKISNWADFEYSVKASSFQHKLNNRSNAPSKQQTHQFNGNFYLFKNTYLSFQNELYVNSFITEKSTNLFSDLTFRYSFPKSKIDLETVCNNIWNTSTLSTVSLSSFSYTESTYQLRPVQIIQRVRFSF